MRVAHLARGVAVAAAFMLSPAAAPRAQANSSPVVSNVGATQIAGTYQVLITYDVSDADGDSVTVRVVCSSNNGVTFDLLPVTLTGDVNVAVAPGPGKQIIWNAGADYPGNYWPQTVAKVIALDESALSGEMVPVPAGDFAMGSEGGGADETPVHTVYLDAFLIDKYEVTNAQYQQFIDAGGYTTTAYWSAEGWAQRQAAGWTEPSYWTTGEYNCGPAWPGFPVVGVSWYEAEAYANFAGKRLPTEAEWEKAARGTDQRAYPWGAGLSEARANYNGSGDPYDDGSTPVGFYDGRLHPSPPFQTMDSPSPYGAYDMAGNVWEWVADWYGADYYSVSPSANPPGPSSGSYRGLRGGAWVNDSIDLRSAYRGDTSAPEYRYRGVGFRCARTLP
jgi:formylglycine-generating enzyme required for sulfatase activity